MINSKNLSFRQLLSIALIANCIFLLFYDLFFKKVLLAHFNNLSDIIDKKYYLNIFAHFDFSLVFFSLILLLIYIFFSKIKNYFLSIRNEKSVLISLVVVSIILQLTILFVIHTKPIADSKFYIAQAERLFQTGSYINASGNLTGFWPVGLPAYLAFLMLITTRFIFLAKLINVIIFSMFIITLYYLFKEELTLRGRLIFLFSFIFFPNNLFSSNCILTDYIFSFLIWLTVFLLLKKENNYTWLIIVSVLLALMSYLRPIGLLLPLIFSVYLIISNGLKNSYKKILLICTIFGIIIMPWIIRNYQVFHEVVPMSTNGGINFLMGNNKNSNGNVDFNFDYDTTISEPNASRKAYIKGIDEILTDPVTAIIRLPKKIFFSYWRGDSSITWSLKETENNISPLILSLIFFSANYSFFILLVISLLSIFSRKKIFRDSRLKNIMVILYIYFILLILVYVGSERYLIPVLPVHFLLLAKFFS